MTLSPGQSYTEKWEGNRLSAYQDQFGNWTIGIGHKLPVGVDYSNEVWTQIQVDQTFLNDYADAEQAAERLLGNICWTNLNEAREAAIVDMSFNLGIRKLSEFHKMVAALLISDWQNAAQEILNSAYAQQVAKRAASNAAIIAQGDWLDG